MTGKRLAYFFCFSVLLILLLPDLFRQGMFMDGTLYSSVSVNYARGTGSFWHPHFAQESMSFFHEQPPLMFGIQGLFFKLFGESMFTERFYALVIFSFTLCVFFLIWKELSQQHPVLKNYAWLALLFWICIPITSWIVINNLEENTMTFFSLLSVLFTLRALRFEKLRSVFFLFLSSLSLTAAFLTKGFPGLYPLALPGIYMLFHRKAWTLKKLLTTQILLFVFLGLLSAGLFSYPPSKLCLETWLTQRVFNSIKNVSNSSTRFEIIWILIQQLIPALLIGVIMLVTVRVKKLKPASDQALRRSAIVLLVLGVCGSLPLMVTREQRTFYIGTSLPAYALSLALFVHPAVNALMNYPWKKVWKTLLLLLSSAICLSALTLMIIWLPTPKRDLEKNHDTDIFSQKIPRGEIVRIPPNMWNDWELQTQLIRKNYISLTQNDTLCRYLITDPPEFNTADTAGYHRVQWGTLNYVVYTKD